MQSGINEQSKLDHSQLFSHQLKQIGFDIKLSLTNGLTHISLKQTKSKKKNKFKEIQGILRCDNKE